MKKLLEVIKENKKAIIKTTLLAGGVIVAGAIGVIAAKSDGTEVIEEFIGELVVPLTEE